jgi:hypothetical protein
VLPHQVQDLFSHRRAKLTLTEFSSSEFIFLLKTSLKRDLAVLTGLMSNVGRSCWMQDSAVGRIFAGYPQGPQIAGLRNARSVGGNSAGEFQMAVKIQTRSEQRPRRNVWRSSRK